MLSTFIEDLYMAALELKLCAHLCSIQVKKRSRRVTRAHQRDYTVHGRYYIESTGWGGTNGCCLTVAR